MSTNTFWIGASWSFGLMHSVAPSAVASGNFAVLTSIPMIRDAPLRTAPWITAMPTAPSPKTATVAPASTLAALRTAPMPVGTAQPITEAFESGASLLIFATAISGSTVYSLNVLVPPPPPM